MCYPAIPNGALGIPPITPGAIIPAGMPGTPTPETAIFPGGVGVILQGESDFALFDDGPSSSSSPAPEISNFCTILQYL